MFTIYSSPTNTSPTHVIDWLAATEILLKHPVKETKSGTLLSPAILTPGATRSNQNVIAVSAFVVDLDNVDFTDALRERLANIEYIAHTTWSHTDTSPHWRVIFPFDTPIAAADWQTVWRKLCDWIGVDIDKSCKEVSRCYFIPSHREGYPYETVTNLGKPRLNPLALPAASQRALQSHCDDILADPISVIYKRFVVNKNGGRHAALISAAQSLANYAALNPPRKEKCDEIRDKIGNEFIAAVTADGSRTPAVAQKELAEAINSAHTKALTPQVRDETQPTDFPEHDTENARQFIEGNFHRVRYCPELGEWFAYDGRRWQIDRDQVNVGELAKQSNLELSVALFAKAESAGEGTYRNKLKRLANRLGSVGSIQAVVKLARTDKRILVKLEQLDAEPYALNCLNGIVNLKSGQLEPHDPARLITKLANVEFDPNAEAKRWRQHLETIFPDAKTQDYFQRHVGSCLSADVNDQKLHQWIGGGANGKSVTVEVIRELMGDYAAIIESEQFIDTRNAPHPTSLMKLMGARFATCNEIEGNAKLSEVKVKRLTGGDRLQARSMGKDFVEFNPTFKPILIANSRPTIQETDEAIRRRLVVIPFDVTIPRGERDPNLKAKLVTELSGVLTWAIEGCQAWQRAGGLNAPLEVENATLCYFDENDSVQAFIDDACLTGKSEKVPKGELYEAYSEWCRKSAMDVKNVKVVNRELKRTFNEYKSGTRYWIGLTLKPEHRKNAELLLQSTNRNPAHDIY